MLSFERMEAGLVLTRDMLENAHLQNENTGKIHVIKGQQIQHELREVATFCSSDQSQKFRL